MNLRDARTPAEIEHDNAVREVVSAVQFVHFLATVPHYLYTFVLLLAIPAVFFRQVFALTDGAVAPSLVAWFLGGVSAVFAGRMVPIVNTDAIIDAMHDSEHPSAHLYKAMRSRG